jgi:hypothetical protein
MNYKPCRICGQEVEVSLAEHLSGSKPVCCRLSCLWNAFKIWAHLAEPQEKK